AITAQNTKGVTAVEDISVATIVAQMDAVFSDLAVNAVKIGMVSRIETIAAIAARLRQQPQPVVLDPVMVATSGDRLLHADAIET
ncbi:bifunctional hydroxymethylpyrimidine kinase/phosphomethylpyrimidine kinase, partial [Agrobacterium tumefaciens]